MNEATLPPSPNWYLASILACAGDGTVAWGTKNAIVIAVPKGGENVFEYSIISDAHLDRVTSLAFSPKFGEPNQNLLVSGGDEHIVRIWNLDSLSASMAHSYTDVQQKVVGVDWSKANPDIISCVSSDGLLVIWNVAHNIAQQISLGKLTATCLACSLHDPNLVAVGTKTGLVYVINAHGNGKIIYKLRGHDAEISSLSWCPIDTNVLTGTNAKDLLLASGAKDRSIFIWRAGGDGRYQMELTLPNSPLDSHQHRSKLGIATGGWSAVCWIAPKLLLASSNWGELISWQLLPNMKAKPACKLVHACHSRGLFCIAGLRTGPEANDDANWRSNEQTSTTVWTLAQDRRVVCCKLKASTSEITYNVPTQGGYTYCIAASPLDTSRVAFGVGDAMLRLWNLCEPHENTFDITMLWQKIKGKVMAISWHPEKENLLAFGTGEGRVGMFDTNTSKPPILYRQYHRHAVYTLGWGPTPNNATSYVLYSCGDGELVYYDPEKPNQEPKSVVKKDCTEFSWKSDNSCLAIGFENGSVSFLNHKLEKFGTDIYSLKKPVQRLQWHPESTSTDLDLSPLRHQLAISTKAHEVVVYDLNDVAEARSATEGVPSPKIVATLNGHTAKVVDLAWSPHISGYLATASYDSTVQVWKTESQELIGTYKVHCGPVHCCMWSPLDPDLIISGSADFTVRIWRLSKQEAKLPADYPVKPKKIRTKKNKNKTKNIVAADRTGDYEDTVSVPQDNDVGMTTVEYATTEQEIREALVTDRARKRRSNKRTTYFPTTSKAMNNKEFVLDSVMKLIKNSPPKCAVEQNSNGNGIGEPTKLSIFGSEDDILELLETEKSVHAKQSQHDMVAEMDLWCNNLKQTLQEAAKAKRLNDFLVSLAPSLSFRVWQETCESYATQLEFEGDRRKAVSYLLCIHKIERAIQVFIEGKMFKEAYVLAKCRLDASDPLVDSLLETWAIAAAREGNFEEAVQCYIKLGNYGEAAKFLSKRKDPRSLEVAAWLALKSGDEEFGTKLAERVVTEALLKNDYDFAENFIETFPQIQHYEVKIAALKEMNRIILEDCDDEKIWRWLEGDAEHCMMQNLRDRYSNCDQYYEKLSKNPETLQTSADETALWLEAGNQIALATACAEEEKRLHHIVAAAEAVSRFETATCARAAQSDAEVHGRRKILLAKLLSQLDKSGPCSKASVLADGAPNIRKSLRAYLCFGILNWLAESDVSQLQKEGRRELVVYLIENTIGDALDQQTVKYNVMSAEVNKLEGSLAVAMGKSQKSGDGDNDARKEVEHFVERLAEIRSEKQKFLIERSYAPNPVLVYSKARELTNALFHDEVKERITQLLTETWTRATS